MQSKLSLQCKKLWMRDGGSYHWSTSLSAIADQTAWTIGAVCRVVVNPSEQIGQLGGQCGPCTPGDGRKLIDGSGGGLY
jgi:hypothetical protein